MTLQDISQQRPPKLTVQQASKIMGVTPRFLQVSLQHERFPIWHRREGKQALELLHQYREVFKLYAS